MLFPFKQITVFKGLIMQNISCKNCGKTISRKAPACPDCGHPNKEANYLSGEQVLAVLAGCIVVIWYVASSDTLPSRHSSTDSTSSSIPQSGISYEEISKKSEGLSELNFENYEKTISGKRIEWTGYVVDADENIGGDCELRIDMDDTGVQDVYVDIPCSQASEFNPKDKVKVDGIIENVTLILKSPNVLLAKNPTLYTFK
jgi:hypothetical protein